MDETTPVPPTTAPAAGWYADPIDGEQLRWWTGQGWSEHTQARVTVPAPAYPQPPAYPQASAYPQPSEYVPMSYSAPAHSPYASDPASEPLPGATIAQSFVRFWSKYAVFSGRASRSEYWWWVLTFGIVYVAALVLENLVPARSPGNLAVALLVLGWVLATIVPSYALVVRRLHDANLSGWNYFWSFIPFAGGIILLVFTLRPSDPAGARFDAGPAAWQ